MKWAHLYKIAHGASVLEFIANYSRNRSLKF
jgi:hypothetical protein